MRNLGLNCVKFLEKLIIDILNIFQSYLCYLVLKTNTNNKPNIVLIIVFKQLPH